MVDGSETQAIILEHRDKNAVMDVQWPSEG